MNKKRVALALAAALGINSLMVTVGTVGGQAVIAHAQDSKLSTDLAAKLDALQIKYLDTSVEVTTNGNAEVTFKNLDFNNVDKIDAGTFAHEIFTERTGIETNGTGANGAWDSTTKKLTVTGMTKPGIYTGDVTVTYKDQTTEKYTLSIVKKPSDSITFKTDVSTGMIKLSGIKLNNGSADFDKFGLTKVTFTLGNKKADATQDANSNWSVSLLELSDGGKLKETDELKVTFEYGLGGSYKLTSQIVLFKDNEKITNALSTNDKDFATKLTTDLNSAFSTTGAVDSGTLTTGTKSYSITLDNKNIVSYVQTVGTKTNNNNTTTVLGGAELSLVTSADSVDVTVKSALFAGPSSIGDYYIPEVTVGYSALTSHSDVTSARTKFGAIGNYTLTLNNNNNINNSITFFEAMKGINPEVKQQADTSTPPTYSSYSYVDFSSQLVNQITPNNEKITLLASSLEHGYQSIVAEFAVNETDDWNSIENVQKNFDRNKDAVAKLHTTNKDSVKTSLIVSADILDGAAVQASFVKTSSSEGKVTIAGGTELLTKIVGLADYTKSVLTIAGGNATVNSTASNGKDLVFDVQFNGQVPSTSDAAWTLKIGDKTATGTVDLTGGVVETVNLTSVKATNQGMENVSDQFRVEASFGTTVPTGGRVTVDTINSDRVTFAQFGVGDHKLISNVDSGKYQGKYSAGVIVSDQPITIQIDEQTKTSSSVTLKIDADFYGNDTTGVTAARISYKEVTTNSNPHEGYLDLNIPQDIKEDVITKVVNGLKANTKYEFGVIYTYKDQQNAQPQLIESNILTVTTNSSSSGSGTISGGSSGSGSSSTSSTTVNVTGTNSTTGSNSISVTLPSGTYHHESNSNPSIAGFKYKDKDGKTVTETNDQYSNVKVRFENGRAVVEGLVPGKDYVEISINYNDRNNRTRTLILKNVKINSTNEGQSYLANVYNVVFNRPADENGYMFHFDNLSNKRVSLRSFLLNMINEREFEKIYTTAETKVEALYNAIVNRDSDTQGKAFWVEEYKKLLAVYGSPAATLQAIADRMVNENELKTLAQKIGFEW